MVTLENVELRILRKRTRYLSWNHDCLFFFLIKQQLYKSLVPIAGEIVYIKQKQSQTG